jgi:hypothetical protein
MLVYAFVSTPISILCTTWSTTTAATTILCGVNENYFVRMFFICRVDRRKWKAITIYTWTKCNQIGQQYGPLYYVLRFLLLQPTQFYRWQLDCNKIVKCERKYRMSTYLGGCFEEPCFLWRCLNLEKIGLLMMRVTRALSFKIVNNTLTLFKDMMYPRASYPLNAFNQFCNPL